MKCGDLLKLQNEQEKDFFSNKLKNNKELRTKIYYYYYYRFMYVLHYCAASRLTIIL